MFQALVNLAGRLLRDANRAFVRPRPLPPDAPDKAPAAAAKYQPLRRVVLSDGVGRTLFEEFAEHQVGTRGEEETGWVLLGLREEDEAVVLATLPAGTERDAGVGHVRFNSMGQALASRIVRQADRRVTILGVVHTHPGSLRHPSDGDYRGDSSWVGQLRGRQGIFGIGTADNHPTNGIAIVRQPRQHVQCLGKLRLSWYALAEGERSYRQLPVALTLGPDLARPLHLVWPALEVHAERLDRLCRQQAGVVFEVLDTEHGPALAANIPLAEAGDKIRVLLQEKEVRYYLLRNGEPLRADPREARVDRAVYLLLAELATRTE
jgi:proteasome lid subunit RPN8/RPN11